MQLREFEVGPDEAVVAGASLLVGEGEDPGRDAGHVVYESSAGRY